MQDISYTSKLTQAEDGRPLALEYYIMANDGERLVTVVIQGAVSAVTEAVEAASQKSIKDIVAKAIIANPHEEIVKMVELSASRL